LLNTPQGVIIDAVLLREREVSILFSFTRSYFHVDVERLYDLVRFLRSIMPRKRIAELYTAIGHHKHGKTELYRDLLHHLAACDDHFEVARGQRGMVMAVFTLPSYDVVFKVIKDHFDAPKDTTRQAVMEKYHLVFKHDRAGRLVDAQEFEHLQFDRWRFSDALLDHLRRVAAQTVIVEAGHVVIKHAYVERRVTPLNLYVREADEDAARAAVLDYGYVLKDLAATNIFPGDMLLKNFGVTRQGRVVFYDYDELCLLTDCTFRSLPQPTNPEEEVAAEPWFAVGEHDIFPEELQCFLGLQGALRDVFMQQHADLFDTQFWHQIEARLQAGETLDIFPYAKSERLRVGPNPEPHPQSAESVSIGG
jgi:isocitrate dehydrogenase kinase/phosphatase